MRLFVAVLSGIMGMWFLGSSPDTFAAEPQEWLGAKLGSDGRLSAGGIRFSLAYYGENWTTFASNDKFVADTNYPQTTSDSFSLKGLWRISENNSPLIVEEKITSENGVHISWKITHPEGVKADSLCLVATIPLATGAGSEILFEGKKGNASFTLPFGSEGKSNLFEISGIHRVVLPSPGGKVEIAGINLKLSIHDDRRFGGSGFSVRFYFSPSYGLIRDSSLDLTLVRFDPAPAPFPTATIQAGNDWVPYEHILEIESGSVFDRSALSDAPAGKYGRVIVSPKGQFVFANKPAQRARFWGINLCFDSLLLDAKQADRLADRLSRAGYNAVRLHHYDGMIVEKDGSSYEFNTQRLDQLEYFFAALKKKGIYITIDLYTFRGFPLSEIPDLGYPLRYPNNTLFKLLVPVSDNALTSWKKFAENLLTHRNPYTNLTWAEDPALISVCMINEDSIFFGGIANRKPELIALYNRAYDNWLKTQPQPISSYSDDERFNRFLIDLKQKSDARMMDHLRKIGVKCLITGDNNINKEAQLYVRNQFDYVDNHEYWNHPIYLKKSIGFNQNSAITSGLWLPRELMPSRIFGKPYTVTEYNYCWPNAARAEGGLLMSAYAALQDWDAVYCFDYSSRNAQAMFTPEPVSRGDYIFSVISDPINMLTDRIAASLFLHGNIQPASGAIAYLVQPQHAFQGKKADSAKLPSEISWLGLTTRVGSLADSNPNLSSIINAAGVSALVAKSPSAVPSKRIPLFTLTPDLATALAKEKVLPTPTTTGLHRSETGQIEISTATGTAQLVTDSAECFVLPPGKTLEGKFIRIENGDAFGAIYVITVDGKPFAESSRLLVLHLTDCLPSGTTFSDKDRTLLEKFGQLPFLVKRGTATIKFKKPRPGEKWNAWTVTASGKRLGPASVVDDRDQLTIQANTVTSEGTILAYEIVR